MGLVLGRPRLRHRRLGGPLRRERHVHARRRGAPTSTASSGARSPRARPSPCAPGRPSTTRWRATNRLLHGRRLAGRPRAERAPAQRWPGRLRRGLGRRGPRPRPGRPLVRRVRLRPGRRPGPGPDGRRGRRRSSACSGTTSRGGRAVLAVRLVGTRSNRDAVGARVTLETDRLRRTRIVQAGSGFLSQHSKELLFGLGPSRRVLKATVYVAERPHARCSRTSPSTGASGWRRAATRSRRSRSIRRALPGRPPAWPRPRAPRRPTRPGSTGRSPRPTSTLERPRRPRALAPGTPRKAGRAAVLDDTGVRPPGSPSPVRWPPGACGSSPSPWTRPQDEPAVRTAARALGLPVALAGEDVAGT